MGVLNITRNNSLKRKDLTPETLLRRQKKVSYFFVFYKMRHKKVNSFLIAKIRLRIEIITLFKT